MRVLLVSDYWNVGGAEAVARETFDALKGEHIVDAFYRTEKHSSPKGIVDYLYSSEVADKLSAKLKAFRPDVVHIHNYYHVLSPSALMVLKRLKEQLGFKVILTAHDHHLICPNPGLSYFGKTDFERDRSIKRITQPLTLAQQVLYCFDHRGGAHSVIRKVQWLYAYKVLKLYNIFDLICTPSEYLKATFEKYQQDLPPIRVLRNPLNFKVVQRPIKKLDNLPILKLVFIGRLSAEKGAIELIDTLAKVSHRNFKLDIFGDAEPEMLEKIKQLIGDVGLSENVCLKGFVTNEELHQQLPSYHAYISHTLCYESASLAVMEAFYNGLWCIVPDFGGVQEMAKLTKCYTTYSLQNSKSLELAMKGTKDNLLKGPVYESFEEDPERSKMLHYNTEVIRLYQEFM